MRKFKILFSFFLIIWAYPKVLSAQSILSNGPKSILRRESSDQLAIIEGVSFQVRRLTCVFDGSDSFVGRFRRQGRQFIPFRRLLSNFRRREDSISENQIIALIEDQQACAAKSFSLPIVRSVSRNREGIPNGGGFTPSISANGRWIVFESFVSDIFQTTSEIILKNVRTERLERISQNTLGIRANGESIAPSISANGTFVTFSSVATNLVEGDSNRRIDIFLRDTDQDTTELISVTKSGVQGNRDSTFSSVSRDGKRVVFQSRSSNFDIFDDNGVLDVFLKNRQSGRLRTVSARPDGFVGDGPSDQADISSDGRFVVFRSLASNLVDNDINNASDIFRKDLRTGALDLVSITTTGEQHNGSVYNPKVNFDGTLVTFSSDSTNLADSLPEGIRQIYLKNMVTGELTLVSSDEEGSPLPTASSNAGLTDDGSLIVFIQEFEEDDEVDAQLGPTSSVARPVKLPPPTATPRSNQASVRSKAPRSATNGPLLQVLAKVVNTGELRTVSSKDGEIGNRSSFSIDVSANGYIIVMETLATNIGPITTGTQSRILLSNQRTAPPPTPDAQDE